MDQFVQYAPMIGLLFFFFTFVGIFIWVLMPANRQRLRSYSEIPLKEDHHGRE